MAIKIHTILIACALGMAGCAHAPAVQQVSASELPCGDRATQIIARNVTSILHRQYRNASVVAERAARASLACASSESSRAQAFSDKWRGANELVVAAELAHQASDDRRAADLLHEGYAVMHALRPPHDTNAMTSSLIADKLDAARRDMSGHWAYW